MRVILLATGETNKLEALTQTIPSPMLPIVGRPAMAYVLDLLARQGIKDIVVSLYSMAGFIESYFGVGNRWGVNLNYTLQPEAWGDAGSLKWAGLQLAETFVVMPADMIVELDLEPLIQQHIEKKSIATVVTSPCREQGAQQSSLLRDEQYGENRGGAFRPGEQPTGIYIFDAKVLDYIPTRTHFDISSQLIPTLISAGLQVDTYRVRGYWNSLESYAQYQQAQKHILESAVKNHSAGKGKSLLRFPLIEARKVREGVWIGRNTTIHPQAQLTPPLFIGDNSFIGKGAEIGPDTVIGKNVLVDEDATVSCSTVLDKTYVGQLVNVEQRIVNNRLVIDPATSETLSIVDRHLFDTVDQEMKEIGAGPFFDGLIALFLLILSLPVTLFIGLLLLLTRGRIFQRCPRIHLMTSQSQSAEQGKPKSFDLLRFNTRNASGTPSGIGKWLERWDLHRIPELWNVLLGQIRLVGVKPLTADESARVTEPWQEKRYEAQPGLTGLWYLQTTEQSDLQEILVADVYYVATHTWSGNIKLLFQSLRTWLGRFK